MAGMVLPEPVACQWLQNGEMVNAFNHPPRADFDHDGYWAEKGYSKAPLYTADQLRQAIADALAKQDVRAPMFKFRECEDSQAMQEPDYEQSETYLRTQSELAKQVPPEKCSLCGAPIGEECFLQNSSQSNCKMAKQVPQGYKLVPETPTNDMTVAMANALEDPENERSSWDLAENMYAAMLAAVPAQQVTRAPMFEFRECDDSQAAAPELKFTNARRAALREVKNSNPISIGHARTLEQHGLIVWLAERNRFLLSSSGASLLEKWESLAAAPNPKEGA
jgi:hypothetical protein